MKSMFTFKITKLEESQLRQRFNQWKWMNRGKNPEELREQAARHLKQWERNYAWLQEEK